MPDREVVIVYGVRTAFGRMGGTIRDITAEQLGGICLKGLLDKTNILDKGKVDDIFAGCAHGVSYARNPARWAMLYAKMPYETSATFIEMQCASAINALNFAAWKILTNNADIIIIGGMESHSQEPAKFSMSLQPYRKNPPAYLVPQLAPYPEEDISMGMTAENLQQKYDISRKEQDEFAFRSQTLAKKAWDNNYFEEEIVPISVSREKKEPPVEFKVDEHLRLSSLETLAKLPPVFKKGGTVTAGNSSGLNDGAAFLLLMTREKALELGYDPLAKWVSGAEAGADPRIMGIAPAYAMPIALKRADLKFSDMDVIECNEAFAVQNLAVIRELEKSGEKVTMDKWNPNGGAIAFGHPNGASGGRLAIFTMKELIRRSGKYGIFSACAGGGLASAAVIENLKA